MTLTRWIIPRRISVRRSPPEVPATFRNWADYEALADAVRSLRRALCRCGGLSGARLTTPGMSWPQADTGRLGGLDSY
jgi:hypothetical protein